MISWNMETRKVHDIKKSIFIYLTTTYYSEQWSNNYYCFFRFDLEPLSIESLVIHPGERYDFILTANQTPGSYWIRAETLQKNVTNHRAEAILSYIDAPIVLPYEPTTQRRNCTNTDKWVVMCSLHKCLNIPQTFLSP